MPRFLSPEWVAAFNQALEDRDLSGTEGDGSLAASQGAFAVRQEVTDVPGEGDRPVGAVLTVDGGRVALALEGTGPDGPAPAVTVALAYADAAAMARGELAVADALATGRIRVRGDLAVLLAGQSVLAAASAHLGSLSADTTY